MTRKTMPMNSLSDFVCWDIWIASVMFEEGTASKVRPVLVIDGTTCYVLSLKITSHTPREECPGEYVVKEWSEAGLLKPSVIRISKRLSLPRGSFIKKIGRLTPLDRDNVPRIYSAIYADSLDE